MKCPICRKEVKPGSPEAPFCSERCRLIDLGKWAAEEYVISTTVRPGEPEEDEK
ncbi:MAG: DNA gyrase inhibitor YacG [Acidobacteria bacterium]|nr:DNA gyrase inhibitor YacG [Acidobacteriota bacterium]MBI3278634.1 DNA gyrase inhibitor YacG [Acidobacteriota bacterium]